MLRLIPRTRFTGAEVRGVLPHLALPKNKAKDVESHLCVLPHTMRSARIVAQPPPHRALLTLLAALLIIVATGCALLPRELFYAIDDRTPVTEKTYQWLGDRKYKKLCTKVRPIVDPDDWPLEPSPPPPPEYPLVDKSGTQLVKPEKKKSQCQ